MKVAVLNKKILAIIALVILILVTGFINYTLAKKDVAEPNSASENNSIVDPTEDAIIEDDDAITVAKSASTRLLQYEAERKIERQKEMQYLNEIIDDDKTDEETRTLANQQKLKLTQAINHEKTISEILVGKGFNEVTVVCGESTINVLIDQVDATDAKIAQILDVVIRETGTATENIKIIPVD